MTYIVKPKTEVVEGYCYGCNEQCNNRCGSQCFKN